MPETLPGSMAAVLGLAAMAAVAWAAQRWLGPGEEGPLAGLWRRARSTPGRRGAGRPPGPGASVPPRPARPLLTLPPLRPAGRAVALRVGEAVRRLRPEPAPSPPVWETAAARFSAEGASRRRGFWRRRGEPAPPQPGTGREPEGAPAPPETSPPLKGSRLDHLPLAPPRREGEETGAEQERLRDRLRRGLRRAREVLNRDVREVFGGGPTPEAFDALEEVLVRADVGVAAATSLVDELRARAKELTSDVLPRALRDAIRAQLQGADRRLRLNPQGLSVWLVVGVNGTGKTTSVVKLAAHAARHGLRVCVAAADTYRAAAIEQLEAWGARLGLEVVRQHAGADPAAVVFDAIAHARARGLDLVVVDTAGRLHTRLPLMEELRKVRRVAEREPGSLTESLLVLDATTGQNGIAQARAFREAVEVTGLLLAKLDGTAKGGIVLAVERELGIPVKAVGVGEGAEDLAPFDPDAFAEALVEA